MGWPSPTLPIVVAAFKAPAYNDATRETVALDALASLAFSSTSDLYQKLVVQEQKVDSISANAPGNVDAGLFEITARVKKAADLAKATRTTLSERSWMRRSPESCAATSWRRRPACAFPTRESSQRK